MGTRIRTGRMDDYEVLDKLMRRAASTFAGYCDDMHARPGAFSISKTDLEAGRVLVAEHEKGILGFASWLPIGDATAHMEGLFIDPPRWRGGLGTTLIEAVCDAVASSGFRNLSVIALSESIGFYRRFGFVRTGATATPLGPALTMMKDITVH